MLSWCTSGCAAVSPHCACSCPALQDALLGCPSGRTPVRLLRLFSCPLPQACFCPPLDMVLCRHHAFLHFWYGPVMPAGHALVLHIRACWCGVPQCVLLPGCPLGAVPIGAVPIGAVPIRACCHGVPQCVLLWCPPGHAPVLPFRTRCCDVSQCAVMAPLRACPCPALQGALLGCPSGHAPVRPFLVCPCPALPQACFCPLPSTWCFAAIMLSCLFGVAL
jgi:hypothetical protein